MEYYTNAFKKYADFTGRVTRKEFWMFTLINGIIFLLLTGVDSLMGTFFLQLVYGLAVIVPSMSIGARRLHDIGRTGWWQLIQLIPFLGWIVLIVFWVQDSHSENQYGPNPKAV